MYPATWVLVNSWIPKIVNFSTKSIHHWFSSFYKYSHFKEGKQKSQRDPRLAYPVFLMW